MSTFNFGTIEVERKDGEVLVHFDGDTLGFVSTSDGFSITNDWNNRHFALGFGENSVLYHLTREDIDKRFGKSHLSPSEFVAEMYGYVRAKAPVVPIDEVPSDVVGKIDMDSLRAYLKEASVLYGKSDGITVEGEWASELAEELASDPRKLAEFYKRVLEPVNLEDAKESGENIFVYPTMNEIFVLLFYPDDTIGVTTVRELSDLATIAGGSPIVDHVMRSIDVPEVV